MSVAAIADLLYQTPLSEVLRSTMWVVPTSQSLHILGIAGLGVSVIVTELRLAGVLATDLTPQAVARHYRPWFWGAFALLLTTGVIQVLAEPTRELNNPLFSIKMGLVVVAVIATMILRYPASRSSAEANDRTPKLIKVLAIASIILWVAIIIIGRWIAYWI